MNVQNTPTAPLRRGKTPAPNNCPGYYTKQSDSEVPSNAGVSLLSLPSSL